MKNTGLWALQTLLALAFLAAGGMKLVTPAEGLAANGMAWATALPPALVVLIGAAEVLGALGLVLPWATGVRRALTPTAAGALALMQAGAALFHLSRGEGAMAPANLVLVVLLLVVAAGRRGGRGAATSASAA